MMFLKALIGSVVFITVLYFLYDRISWHLAKYDDAKRAVIFIASRLREFRDCISDASGKGHLDETFREMQIANANIAYVLGGVKLLDVVSKGPISDDISQNTDIIK